MNDIPSAPAISSAPRIAQIHKNFQAFLDERRLGVSEAFVAAENINALLEQGGVTGEIAKGLAADFLLVDIDVPEFSPSWDLTWELVRLANSNLAMRTGERAEFVIAADSLAPPAECKSVNSTSTTAPPQCRFDGDLRQSRTRCFEAIGSSLAGRR